MLKIHYFFYSGNCNITGRTLTTLFHSDTMRFYQLIQRIKSTRYVQYVILTGIIFSSSFVCAHDTLSLVNNLQIGAEIHYGSVLPHSESIQYALKSNIERFQLTLSTNTYGRSVWDKAFRYPVFGAGYSFSTLGNSHVFGHAHALFLFMDIPFCSRCKKFKAGYQLNLGLSYLDRVFDVDENPLNMAISSGLNVYGCFNLNVKYRLNEKHELMAGFNMSHYSNGKLATPNLGINTSTFSAGYSYTLIPEKYPKMKESNKPTITRHHAEIIVSGGTKTDDQVTGRYYFISSLVADYRFVLGLKYSLCAGTDLFYDRSLGPNKVADEGGSYSSADLYQAGLHGGFIIRYSKLNVVLQVGGYIHANYYKYARVYSRVGIRYEVADNILLNVSLKSHYAIADYVEWGIGYRF